MFWDEDLVHDIQYNNTMLYLYGDESNTPGADKIWAVGFLFSSAPSIHMQAIAKIRKECSFEFRELKYSSTDYSQILCAVRIIDYFLSSKELYFKILIKAMLSKCSNLEVKCKAKLNYYWPSFSYQKINVFYWKNKMPR